MHVAGDVLADDVTSRPAQKWKQISGSCQPALQPRCLSAAEMKSATRVA